MSGMNDSGVIQPQIELKVLCTLLQLRNYVVVRNGKHLKQPEYAVPISTT